MDKASWNSRKAIPKFESWQDRRLADSDHVQT